MRILNPTSLGLFGPLAALCLATPAIAASTVNISLWDKGEMAAAMLGDTSGPHMMGMGMMKHMDMPMAMVGVKADVASVPAGEVTFNVTNDSEVMQHEMLVVPVADETVALPYSEDAMAADEEAAGSLGEVPELDPGATGSLTLTLSPGKYLLFCNIPGHYAMGMWTLIEVTG